MKRHSIVCQLEKCYVCGRQPIEKHEVFYGRKNRQLSIDYGLVIPLCYEHHNKDEKSGSIHFCKEFNLKTKSEVQQIAMKHYGWSMEDWMKIFRENYIL